MTQTLICKLPFSRDKIMTEMMQRKASRWFRTGQRLTKLYAATTFGNLGVLSQPSLFYAIFGWIKI